MKKIVKLTETDLTRIVNRVVNEQLEDKSGDLYSDINKLIDYEYSDLGAEEIVDVLENILDNMKGRSHRERNKIGSLTKDDVLKNWSMNESE